MAYTLQGVAKHSNGLPADSVAAIHKETKELIAKTTPGTEGNWSLDIPYDTDFYMAYFLDGCAPIIHGPYSSPEE